MGAKTTFNEGNLVNITTQELKQGRLSPERLAEAVRTFRDTGLLILDNIYAPDFIAKVRAAYDAELESHLAAQGGLKALEGKTFGKNHLGFFPPLKPPFSDPALSAQPIAVQVMTELLGSDLQCSFYNTNTAYPDSEYQPIHRDQSLLFGTELRVPLPVTQIVINIPLCDFTEENGSTEVWPGTHLVVDTRPDEGEDLEARAALLPSIRMNLKVGSLLLRDLRCWHRGMPNQANYPRTMFALVYQRGWLTCQPMQIPRSTWQGWPETAKHIFRNNPVVEDKVYQPSSWE